MFEMLVISWFQEASIKAVAELFGPVGGGVGVPPTSVWVGAGLECRQAGLVTARPSRQCGHRGAGDL